MQITQIRLRNYKLFEKIDLDLRPITLLTGINSSGKSTVLNSIASVLQTPPPHMFPFDIVLNGENCALGTYKDITTNKTTKINFGIGFTLLADSKTITLEASFRYSPRGEHILPHTVEYKVEGDSLNVLWAGTNKGYRCNFESESLKKLHSDKSYRAFLDSLTQFIETQEGKRKAKVRVKLAEEMLSDISSKEVWVRGKSLSPRDLVDKIASLPVGNHLINDLRSFSIHLRNKINYVGPIRAMPLRFYTPDKAHYSVDPQGENCAQLLNDWRKHNYEKFNKVGKLLSELELIDGISTKSTSDDILKIFVKPMMRKEESNFVDVGFGVSQALPFIVSDVALPKKSVLCINQPEVHLHPTSQAKLANLFASRCEDRQYIIETHSEYMLNRLRLLVLKKKIKPEMIRILFFNSQKNYGIQPEVHHIEINSDGSLKDAPPEFFETYYSDSFELAMGGESNE